MDKETIPCKWCRKQTPMLGTKMCDGCWELSTRISRDLDLAERMIEHFGRTMKRLNRAEVYNKGYSDACRDAITKIDELNQH